MKRHLAKNAFTRRGVSLVELLVTMGFASVVLGTGIGTLHLLLRTDKVLSDSLWRSQTVSRLSETFRSDTHAARNVSVEQPANDPAPEMFVFDQGEGHVVRYSIDKHSLFRKETKGDQTLHQERFRFSPGTVISIQTDQPNTVALKIQSLNPVTKERRNTLSDAPMRELRIEAVKSRDHRFEQSEENTP